MRYRTVKELLYIDQITGKVSNTKVFANAGYVSLIVAFIWRVVHGTDTPEMWLIFSSVVVGNATVGKVLNLKYGQGAAKSTTEESNASSK